MVLVNLSRIKLPAVLFFCGLAGSAYAEERLAMPKFPTGWVEAFVQNGNREIAEYVPAGQTAENWDRKITLEIYRDLNNLPLDTLQRRASAQNREGCNGVIEGKFQSGVNNGFASAFWTLGCGRRSGKGEARYTKVIQGSDRLYVLSQDWLTAPYTQKNGPSIPVQEIEAAMTFLTSSVICDPTKPKHPCPAEPAPR